jgi:hypothetical protein
VFNLPDQLALRLTESTANVRVVSDRDHRRKTGQARAQRDTLLLATPVLQGDFHIDITRIPPPKVWTQRQQRPQHVRTLLRHETRTDVEHVPAENISLSILKFAHRGRSP